ncbi:MAG: FkbM family methyltransferase [Parachlamydiaceae bacterium]
MENSNRFLYHFKRKYGSFFLTLSLAFSFMIYTDLLGAQSVENGTKKLENIHSKLTLIHGNMLDEYPEQLMTAMYLSKHAKVLEIGANCGRNSLVIASILKDSKHLVCVESSADSAQSLKDNRDANGFDFHIEDSAISKVPLIQSGWKTIPSEVDVEGWTRVKTISFKKLKKKYNIQFDTLIVDCEGALYYILRDEPYILNGINLVIIENDFDDYQQMLEVQTLFKRHGLECVYNEPFTYEGKPCANCRACGENFYQVWKKIN